MASTGMHSPIEQFKIKPIVELSAGGYDISFTNSSLFMLLAMLVGGLFLASAMSKREMVGPHGHRPRERFHTPSTTSTSTSASIAATPVADSTNQLSPPNRLVCVKKCDRLLCARRQMVKEGQVSPLPHPEP